MLSSFLEYASVPCDSSIRPIASEMLRISGDDGASVMVQACAMAFAAQVVK